VLDLIAKHVLKAPKLLICFRCAYLTAAMFICCNWSILGFKLNLHKTAAVYWFRDIKYQCNPVSTVSAVLLRRSQDTSTSSAWSFSASFTGHENLAGTRIRREEHENLKKAALCRMCTVMKCASPSLAYMEQIR
jgi:hypothetical protein